MPEATSANCANAFIRHWVKHWGLPTHAKSDNGNTFIANLWKDLHAKLGTIISYSPLYHPSSLGSVEREHKEIKNGLKAALLEMGTKHQHLWMDCLPWILLGRRTTYQPAIGATPAELIMGECPKIPGDLAAPPQYQTIDELLLKLRQNADKDPSQTTKFKPKPVYWPASVDKATHVYVEVAKKTPLGPAFKGPFRIEERLGNSCLKIFVGNFKTGKPRYETVHWNNVKPMLLKSGAPEATRPALGRPTTRNSDPTTEEAEGTVETS